MGLGCTPSHMKLFDFTYHLPGGSDARHEHTDVRPTLLFLLFDFSIQVSLAVAFERGGAEKHVF